MEWVEKAYFERLNKIFEISTAERNHQVLLRNRNLLAVVRESKTFLLPILPSLVPQSVVPDEHHVLKDLSCYEVACATDSKVHQDRLDQREKI